jgi:multicomponent K+:H+ antiporter subunit A
MFFAETVFINSTKWVEIALPVIATVAGTFSVAYALRFTVDVFFGPPATDLPHTPHEPPRWMRAPVELLVFTCLMVGIFPAQTVGPLLAAAAQPVVGGQLPEYSLAIWHGLNAPMIMSLIAMFGRYRALCPVAQTAQAQSFPATAPDPLLQWQAFLRAQRGGHHARRATH